MSRSQKNMCPIMAVEEVGPEIWTIHAFSAERNFHNSQYNMCSIKLSKGRNLHRLCTIIHHDWTK